tara:strand:- start:60 stop:293 length:234 start_codon:yes stop_codon:yes gene_type:complete
MMVDEYGADPKLAGNDTYALEFVPNRFPLNVIDEAKRVEGVSRGGGYKLPLMLLVVNCRTDPAIALSVDVLRRGVET